MTSLNTFNQNANQSATIYYNLNAFQKPRLKTLSQFTLADFSAVAAYVVTDYHTVTLLELPPEKTALLNLLNSIDSIDSTQADKTINAAAKQAALGYFEAAGYTVADGKITAAPAGGRMDAEVMVGGSGKGDHPSFMALTLASDALKEIGFNLIVSDMSNFAEMTNAINAGTADMFAMAWQATPDPDMFQIYHSQGGSNEKSYWIKDADLDELIMMARQSTDQTYRKTLYKQCLDIVADWAVEIPIYQRQNCVIFSAKRVNLDTVTPDITTYWTWYNDIELLDLQ